jgi:hypothetical protein
VNYRNVIIGLLGLGAFAFFNREPAEVPIVEPVVSEPVVIETPGSDDRIYELEAEVARMQADGVVIPEDEPVEAEPIEEEATYSSGHWEWRRIRGKLRRQKVWVQ